MNNYSVADFFCGAGGFSEGFHQSGFNVKFSLDIWKQAIETHKLNHPECKSIVKNILELDTPEKIDEVVPDTDIIIGSPPCVSFSNSNKSTKLHNKTNEELNDKELKGKELGLALMKSYLRIILHKKTKENSKLKYWILENVENSIVFFEDKSTFTGEDLGLHNNTNILEIKYLDGKSIKSNVLNAYDYGAPQNRRRLIIGDFIKPKISLNKFCMKDVFDNLGSVDINNANLDDEVSDLLFQDVKLKKKYLTDHYYDMTIPKDMWLKSKKMKIDHGFMGKMSFPENIMKPSRTVMATESFSTRESMIFLKDNTKNEYRGASIRELACFMGFPINYQFTGNKGNKHKQIGNAVCVPLSYALANGIKRELLFEESISRIQLLNVNLNDLEEPVFKNYTVKPKKITSKYHTHPPFLKIKSFRCELINTNSNFEEEEFIWNSEFHKGSGKSSLKIKINNDLLIPILIEDDKNTFIEFKNIIDNKLNECIYDSKIFQKKMCLIECNDKHYSPDEILEFISCEIKKLDFNDDDEFISNDNLDKIFHNTKNLKDGGKLNICKNKYSHKVLYSVYCINKIEEILNHT